MSNQITQAAPSEETVAQKWGTLVFWLGFSALELWVLIYGNLKFERWRDWLIVGGAFFFPAMALWAARELTKDTRVTGVAHSVAALVKWLLAAPVVLVAVGLAGWLLFSFFGWLASIPAWAAVIIVLLLLKR